MKRILAIILALSMLLCLAACGEAEPDPNAGLYEGRSASYGGLSIGIETVFDEFALELKNGGKASFHYNGESYGMKWTLDGETFHAEGGGAELDGTLSGGVMVLQNVLDSGIDITLVCDALAAAAPGGTAAEPAGTEAAETAAEPEAAEPVETEAEPEAAEPAETAAEPAQEDGSIDPSFLFGQWRHESGYTYTFGEEGVGSYGRGGEEMAFTYEVTASELRILYEGSTSPMTLGYTADGDLLTIVDSFGRDVYYDKIIPEPVLEALATLPVFDAQQAMDMCNWIIGDGRILIEDDVFYGSFYTTYSNTAYFTRVELSRGGGVGLRGWGMLDEDNKPLFVQKRGDTLYYIMVDRDSGDVTGIACVGTDGGGRRVLVEGDLYYLTLMGERMVFTDEDYRLFSADLEGGDLQLILDKEVYYPYLLSEDWLLYQDDADNESLHLYYLPEQIDIKLNDEPSYNPILVGDKLFFAVYDGEVEDARHFCRIDLSKWEEVYDEALGCHVPHFTTERSEKLFGGWYATDGEIFVPGNNWNGVSVAYWMDLEDDAYRGLDRCVNFFSDDYEVDYVYDENGYVDRVMFYDRASGYGNALPWLS